MPVDAIKPAPTSSTCSSSPLPTEPAIETVTLRSATPSDAAALALVGAATFLEAFTWMLPGADIIAHCAKNHTVDAYAHYLAQPTTRITLAVTGIDVPIGYAMLTAPELPTFNVLPTDLELKRIYLFSRFRSSSVVVTNHPGVRTAQALMDAAIDDAQQLLAKRLLLGTHGGNTRAISFYRRNGFVEAGTRTFKVGTQECCDLIFAKDL
jgi:ribosomal protein S18 acetylase RimI-like enzyme